jgi:hypothetical protein
MALTFFREKEKEFPKVASSSIADRGLKVEGFVLPFMIVFP